MDETLWKCPKCGATLDKCGRGTCNRAGYSTSKCMGLICECDETEEHGDHHGETQDDPCKDAYCDHCGWAGRMPPKAPRKKPELNPAGVKRLKEELLRVFYFSMSDDVRAKRLAMAYVGLDPDKVKSGRKR